MRTKLIAAAAGTLMAAWLLPAPLSAAAQAEADRSAHLLTAYSDGRSPVSPAIASSSAAMTADRDGLVDSAALRAALSASSRVMIRMTGTTAYLPASALRGVNPGAMLTVYNALGSTSLPVSALDVEALAEALGTTPGALSVSVTIQLDPGPLSDAAFAAAARIGGTVVSSAVEFRLEARAANGRAAALDLGPKPVSHVMVSLRSADPRRLTAARYDETGDRLTYAPASFAPQADGTSAATILARGTGLYLLLDHAVRFRDTTSHWARPEIELLAGKLIADGVTPTTFAPDRPITRAEFAALAVRALGLLPAGNAPGFSDVPPRAWYSGAVAAAARAGLVDGYEDGTFRPEQTIRRGELAVLALRALRYAGAPEPGEADLGRFRDAGELAWAHRPLAEAVAAGLLSGVTGDRLAPSGTATRSEAVVVLRRMLAHASLLD
ncbi:hypothetical protein J31TS4_33880 [Paenibacillus sp. J31TS4]|uniref:S-layer homology domain-containing protein n=1 Tax=Paenibacillus sp. J31TS4 TaxID=2807195 RepID=UPI001B106401|nr:S-layer homology domain-containing protein [Paenibacillus sp. J31TS4]GIP40108.1 hypothetical protein J31TS4_33880 [Paenibacillus sp. J31TS4]